jgi:hypothetical protein
MMDESTVWMVIENEKDKKLAEEIKQRNKYTPYKSLEITYGELKECMKLDYLQIGSNDNDHDIISGVLEINGLNYKVEGFEPETTINMEYFKQFWKKLTEGVKLKRFTVIKMLYYKNFPVWFEIQGREGAIAPKVSKPEN